MLALDEAILGRVCLKRFVAWMPILRTRRGHDPGYLSVTIADIRTATCHEASGAVAW